LEYRNAIAMIIIIVGNTSRAPLLVHLRLSRTSQTHLKVLCSGILSLKFASANLANEGQGKPGSLPGVLGPVMIKQLIMP
jgi:hypothetical protein